MDSRDIACTVCTVLNLPGSRYCTVCDSSLVGASPGVDTSAWKDWVLKRMMYGPLALRAKGKTVEQIVTDALSATGLSDVALATSLLESDGRFTTGDKLKRWVPAECAGLVAETLQRKVEKKATRKAARGGTGFRPRPAWDSAAVDAAPISGDGAPVASAESQSPVYTRSGAPVRGRGGWRGRGRGGGVPGAAPALRARIAVEDTTQSAQRYVDQLNVGGDDDDESDEGDDLESRDAADDGEVARGVRVGGEAAAGLAAAGGSAVPAFLVEEAAAGAAAGATPAPAARAAVFESYFFSPSAGGASGGGGGGGADLSRCVLVDRPGSLQLKECALLGVLSPQPTPAAAPAPELPPPPPSVVFLNTHQPFCLVTVGVQGGGKSHTLACVLESVLLHSSSSPADEGGDEEGVVKLAAPQNALVLHYDQNVSSVCEATGLVHPHPALTRALRRAGVGPPAALPRDRMVVLVSPSYYLQRKAFYGDYCDVRPLLFRW